MYKCTTHTCSASPVKLFHDYMQYVLRDHEIQKKTVAEIFYTGILWGGIGEKQLWFCF